jgi:signal transduction histidine kinase/CheY-like chemotaxis protein
MRLDTNVGAHEVSSGQDLAARMAVLEGPIDLGGCPRADGPFVASRYACRMMETAPIDDGVRRQLLAPALRNSSRSVLLLTTAVIFIVVLGVGAGRPVASAFAGLVGMIGAVWRHLIGRRFADTSSLIGKHLDAAERQLEANAAISGLMWAIATIGIYPSLSGPTATTYVSMIFGSITVAAFFMTLVGRSFAILAGIQLIVLILVSVFFSSTRSLPLAALAVIFGVTVFRASRELKTSAVRGIEHSQEADAANELLKRAKEAAETANLAKSQFLATMSHEIRTPMNGVLGALDLLKHSGLTAAQRDLVRTASSSGTSLMAILNDVLDHSKIEAGKLNLSGTPLSLHALAASVISLFQANAESRGLDLSLYADSDLEEWVIADGQRLKQVLLNLVGNAIKFTERGAVSLFITREPSTEPSMTRVRFDVRDTGIGITPEALTKLFQPFQQADGSRSRRQGGTGLGLAISQRIVEAMGSRIEVVTAPGVGSRFSFVLRLEVDRSSVHVAPPDSSMGSLDGGTAITGTVLVVEDNEVNRMIARQVLQSFGLDVVEASNGQEAILALENRSDVDVVLMDCQMPVMDGYAATREIRRRESEAESRHVPILALTADAFDDDAVRARESGMDGHLAKPYTRDQLGELLKLWIDHEVARDS